jgi:hypothetical protein
MRSDALRKAVESFDYDGVMEQFADDIVLHSPVTFKAFEGKQAVGMLFAILFRTFEDFRYVGEFESDDGRCILHFLTRVGDRQIEGIDMVRFDSDGLVDDFTVMVRPLSAALALRDAIGSQLGATP